MNPFVENKEQCRGEAPGQRPERKRKAIAGFFPGAARRAARRCFFRCTAFVFNAAFHVGAALFVLGRHGSRFSVIRVLILYKYFAFIGAFTWAPVRERVPQ